LPPEDRAHFMRCVRLVAEPDRERNGTGKPTAK